MKLTLRFQLIALGAVNLAILGTMALVAWLGVRTVTHSIDSMQERTSLVRASAEGDMMHDAIRGDVLGWLLATDDAGRSQAAADLEEHAATFAELLGKFEGAKVSEEEHAAHASARKAVDEYVASAHRLMQVDRASEGKIAEARADFDTRFYDLEDQLEALSELIEKSAQEVAQEAMVAPSGLMRRMGVALCAGVLAIAGALFFITRSLLTRTGLIQRALERIGSGDLTSAVGLASGDELGAIAKGVDATRQSLSDILRDVKNASEHVRSTANTVHELTSKLNTDLQRQQEESTQVAAAVEELAASVQEVSKQGSQASDAAMASRKAADEGKSVVAKTVDSIQSIAHEIHRTSEAVNALGKRGEQIGVVVSTIDEIAEQTNLLALNAAIEAARAGEHGRGFAVVADEVRKLAERTQRATEEVSRSIREMQDQTTQAVQLMQQGGVRIRHSVELASGAGAALARINEGSSNLVTSVTTIASANSEQATASSQISRSLQTIESIATSSARGASEALDGASQLQGQSQGLLARVAKFKLAA